MSHESLLYIEHQTQSVPVRTTKDDVTVPWEITA